MRELQALSPEDQPRHGQAAARQEWVMHLAETYCGFSNFILQARLQARLREPDSLVTTMWGGQVYRRAEMRAIHGKMNAPLTKDKTASHAPRLVKLGPLLEALFEPESRPGIAQFRGWCEKNVIPHYRIGTCKTLWFDPEEVRKAVDKMLVPQRQDVRFEISTQKPSTKK